jgi:hypothetical protein
MTGTGKKPSDSTYRTGMGMDARESDTDTLRDKAEEMSGRVKDHVTRQVKQQAGELKRQAKAAADDMRSRAGSVVDQQKHAAAGRVEGIAHALRAASDQLREQGQPMVAEYSRYAAEGLETMAQSLDRRDVGDFVEGVEQFARERPVVFLSGAMVAGFALARFMKSSSTRRDRSMEPSVERRSATVGAAANPVGGTTTPGVWTPEPGVPGAGG